MDGKKRGIGERGIALPDEVLGDVVGGLCDGGSFDGWSFWHEDNPWKWDDPYNFYLDLNTADHDYYVQRVQQAIFAGDYGRAKSCFMEYRLHWGFSDVESMLNSESISMGLGPLM